MLGSNKKQQKAIDNKFKNKKLFMANSSLI